MSHPGFDAHFLCWEGCRHASQIQSGGDPFLTCRECSVL